MVLRIAKNRWFWTTLAALLLIFLSASIFRPQDVPTPPPDYDLMQVGMTTKEVSLVLGRPEIADIPCDREVETGWNQAEGDIRNVHVRFDHGRLVEKKWSTYSDKFGSWEAEVRYRLKRIADRSGLSHYLATREVERLKKEDDRRNQLIIKNLMKLKNEGRSRPSRQTRRNASPLPRNRCFWATVAALLLVLPGISVFLQTRYDPGPPPVAQRFSRPGTLAFGGDQTRTGRQS
jgi:hypothetical protein